MIPLKNFPAKQFQARALNRFMMLSSFVVLITLFFPFSGFAQDDMVWVEASPSSKAYRKFRLKSSIPPYGLAKIKKLIANTKENEEGQFILSKKVYLGLTLREKFTYHMTYAENENQNCDIIPPILNEDKKIFANLPDAFDEATWSERQVDFLRSNRDSVMSIIRESVTRSKRMGINYKNAIVEINGREMIPFLIDFYKVDKKDHDVLTILLLLMKKNEYKPFMTSASYVKLYGTKSDYQSALDYNMPNEELIIQRAAAYHNGLK